MTIFEAAATRTLVAGLGVCRRVMLAAALFIAPICAQASEIEGLQKARQAAISLSKGQLSEAIALYTEALADKRLTNDRKAVILTDRGVVYGRLSEPDKAIADFNEAVTLFPENAATYNNRGAYLVSLGAIDEGIKDFDRALVLAPGYVAAWNNRAAARTKTGHLYAAIDDYTHAVRLAPNLAEPLTGRAHVYLTQARPNAALRDLSRALQNDSRSAVGYRARAEAHMAMQLYKEAAQDLSRAIAFDPVDAKAYLLRGEAYLRSKNADAALKDFSKVVELDPHSADGFRERGNVNVLIDEFDAAEQDFARSLELDPRGATTYAYRALMYKKRDQAELGAQEIKKAVRLAPDNAIVLWAKGEIEEARGLPDEAIESYRKALAGDPELEMAQLGLRRLGQDPAPDTVSLPESSGEGWQVVAQGTRYFAVNDEYPKLKVPLEMAGTGQPRILGWEEKDGALKGIGLLRFEAGKVAGAVTEYVAILDLRGDNVVAIEPQRRGKDVSTWRWEDGQVTVTAVDGLTSVHALRRIVKPPRPETVSAARGDAGRRRARSSGTPDWVPWGDTHRSGPSRTTSRRRGRRPKTLFDLILGN